MKAIRDSSLRKRALSNPQPFKHLAVFISGGRILAQEVNDSYGHAETNLFSRGFQPGGGMVLSIRVRKDGSFANARPCPNCWSFLKKRGVKKVRWTTSKGWMEERL